MVSMETIDHVAEGKPEKPLLLGWDTNYVPAVLLTKNGTDNTLVEIESYDFLLKPKGGYKFFKKTCAEDTDCMRIGMIYEGFKTRNKDITCLLKGGQESNFYLEKSDGIVEIVSPRFADERGKLRGDGVILAIPKYKLDQLRENRRITSDERSEEHTSELQSH